MGRVRIGKTIEAGLILRELKIRGLVRRILVVAPAGLVLQWQSEMKSHFHEDFRLRGVAAVERGMTISMFYLSPSRVNFRGVDVSSLLARRAVRSWM